MRIVTLNVNGLRAFDEKNGSCFNEFCLDTLKADIICLQEIKGSEGSLSKYASLKDYRSFTSFHTMKGRHGVSTLVKKSLYCDKSEEIEAGRILKTYHGNFVIYNCYLPYFDETTEGDKTEIIRVYEKLTESLNGTRTIICGDLNATYNILDHYQYYNEAKGLIKLDNWITHKELKNLPQLLDYTKLCYKELEKLSQVYSKEVPKVNSKNSQEISKETKLNSKSKSNKKSYKKTETTENFEEEVVIGKNISIRINDQIKEKAGLFLKMKEAAEEYLDDSMLTGMVEKIRPSQTEVPYHFFNFEKLENYFFSVYQRDWLRKLIDIYTDTFRIHNDKLEQFTCWNTIFNLRRINWGTRIDYILCSKDLECTSSEILPEIYGSDHCPVSSEFNIEEYKDDSKNLVKKKNNLLDFFKVKK